jgi:hypothetical protein
MRNAFLATSIAALGFATPAHAISFVVDDYTVTQFVESPGNLGLNILVSDVMIDDYAFDLNFVGDTHEVPLFRIGTNEGAAAQSDDVVQKPISVALQFASPSTSGGLSGVTGGTNTVPGDIVASLLCALADGCGYVQWGAPAELLFGNTGRLQISLSDTLFGSPGSGLVKAKFKLLECDCPDQEQPIPTPEPGTLALFATGLATAVARVRRRLTAN